MIFERHVLEYLGYLVGKGLARETVRWRRSPLATFGRYLARNRIRSLTDIGRDTMEGYLSTLKSGALSRGAKPPAEGTYRDHLIALTDFFRWLVFRGLLLVNPMDDHERQLRRRPPRLPRVMTPEEVGKVLASCTPTTALGLRDRAILELLYSTGIRKGELTNLNLSDFRVESRELLVVDGKGGKDRIVPVGEYACGFTEAYVRLVRPWQVHDGEEKALFVQHRNGRRLSLSTASHIVEKATERSGVGKWITAHTFRHL